jgi:hypothetical protein
VGQKIDFFSIGGTGEHRIVQFLALSIFFFHPRPIFHFLGFELARELPLVRPIGVLQLPDLTNPPVQFQLALPPEPLDLHPIFFRDRILTILFIFDPFQL